jgi:hypothetical protein
MIIYRLFFVVVLSVFITLAAVPGPAASLPGPDGGGYYSGRTNYDWVDISSTGTAVVLDDDDFTDPISFPQGFSFVFYGVSYTDFYIQSNGLISFFENSANRDVIDEVNECLLPTAGVPENFIALMWDDLDPSYDGAVFYQVFTQNCPYQDYQGQCVVIQFQNIQLYGAIDTGDDEPASTFEAILFDNNHIVVQFNSSDLGTNWGNTSTTGIEGRNPDSDHGICFSCNTAGSLFSGLAVEFSKNPDITYKKDFYWPMFLPAIIQPHTIMR